MWTIGTETNYRKPFLHNDLFAVVFLFGVFKNEFHCIISVNSKTKYYYRRNI